MSDERPVVVVGAASAAALGDFVTCLPTLGAASHHVGDPRVRLVLADTAPADGPMTLHEAVLAHTSAGGQTVVLCASGLLDALTWDAPGAVAIALPAPLGALASFIGVQSPLPAVLDADVRAMEHVPADRPVPGWKRGYLWLDPATGQILASGAHARMPVIPDVDARCDEHDEHPVGIPDPTIGCYTAFSAFPDRHPVRDRWPEALVFEVALSGRIVIGGTPRGGNLHLLAGHQRLAAVELLGVCRDCGAPTDLLSGKARAGGLTVLIERCEDHLVAHTVTQEQLAELLPGVELRTSAETAGR